VKRYHPLVLIVAGLTLARVLPAQTLVLEAGSASAPPAGAPSLAASPFAGGVPSGQATAEVLKLTLADVIARGMESNLGRVLADERVRAAAAEHALTRSRVLPVIDASATGERAKISLDEFGFPVTPGQSPLLGPFNVLDLRVALDSALLDTAGLARTRAAAAGEEASRHGLADARELVVTACTALYLQVVAAESRVAATHAQVETARALDARAHTLKDAGVVATIDVLRASYQLAAQRLRQIDADNQLAKDRLALARAIGLPLAQPYELVDREPYAGVGELQAEAAIAQALTTREEVKEQEAAVHAAEERLAAARNERMPSLWLHADWGQLGPDSGGLNETYSAVAVLKVPIFQGGAISGREQQAAAALAQQRAALADLRARVELEVRSALVDVAAAADRDRVAGDQSTLAAAQLAQAQDRFVAGVADNLEVVQAQEAVAAASDAVISGRAGLGLARLRLARAVGAAASSVSNAQGGAR
jgi:outer membrane protein TolC